MRDLGGWNETEKRVCWRNGKKNRYNTLEGVEPKMAKERSWYVPRKICILKQDRPEKTIDLSMEHPLFIDDLVHPSEQTASSISS